MADDRLNDHELVSGVGARKEDAVSRLYDLCRAVTEPLYYYLGMYGLWSQEDMVQELFVLLLENDWHKLKTWKGECSLKTWVGTVANHHFRRAAARRSRTKPLTDEASDDLRSGEDDPSEAVIRAMSVSAILKAVEQLPDSDKHLILMWYNDHTPAEIAAVVGITSGAVRSRKHRALERLRAIVQAGGLANV
jgi:RNA polymerase sigma-70 factor (ECF subfamily)